MFAGFVRDLIEILVVQGQLLHTWFRMQSARRSLLILGAVFSAFMLAAVGWELMLACFHFDLREGYALEEGMLSGHPHWRLFQNRMLAPSIFGAVRYLTGWQTPRAYHATFLLLLSLFYLSLAFCLWNLTKRLPAVVSGLLTAFALNAVLLQPPWLYLWDLIDLTVFVLLSWALLTSQPMWVVTAVIGIEIFNREVALILAGLFFVDAFLRRDVIGLQQARRQMVLGTALAIFGLIIIEALRRALLVAEVGRVRWPWIHSGSFFNIQIWTNLRPLLGYNVRHVVDNLPQYGTIFAFAVWITYESVRGNSAERRTALWCAALFVAVCVVGYAYEWRVWLIFVPYVVLTLAIRTSSVDLCNERSAAGTAT